MRWPFHTPTLAIIAAFAGCFDAAQAGSGPAVAVSPQYDATHVYVAPEDFDRLTDSLVATFGGSKSQKGIFQVILHTGLLAVAALVAARFGPFDAVDGAAALTVGMTLVAAMAIVNAAHRIHFTKSPPLTLMTGTSTQIMIDLADRLAHRHPELATEAQARIKRMATSVLVFATGCAAGALLYAWAGTWCFCVPVLLALATVMMREGLAQAEPHV